MAIDGRDIARARAEREAGGPVGSSAGSGDAYESLGVRVVSHALIWVPAAAVVWLAYVSGTWLGGGWIMGVLSVVSTLATFGVLWLWMKVRKRRH
jgi:Flp pilus assembly protein TadB